MSLSVGVPLSVGLGGSYSAHYGSYESESNTLRFMFNLPLVFNINFGRGAVKNADSRFGFFAGAGYGYHYGSRNDNFSADWTDEYSHSTESSTTGPVANAGFRIGIGRKHNLEIKLAYMKGTTGSKPDISSLGTLFNF